MQGSTCDEAIQLSLSQRRSWIASRSLSSGAHSRDPLARNDGVSTGVKFQTARGRASALSRREAPELCVTCRPQREQEGAGKAGCALHPRSRAQLAHRKRTRAYRFSGNTPASPAQWLYGLWRDLLGDEFLFVTVAAGFKAEATRLDRIRHRQLGISNGCRNHTLLPYASAPFVCALAVRSRENPPCDHLARRRCRVHRICTHVRDDHDTPLLPGETGGVVKVICPTAPAKYF